MKKYAKIISWLAIFLLCLFLVLFVIRLISPGQMDDVNPLRFCESKFITKSETLMIIPLLDNISIAENKSWCDYILGLNKTLAMHGVYHDFWEFKKPRDKEYISLGMEEFRKCFGFYPTIFEAPQGMLSFHNRALLKSFNFKLAGWPNFFIRKVYHCVDYQKKSYLVKLNGFVSWV